MNETLKCNIPIYYDISCSYCASVISFGLEDTIHSEEGEGAPYRYLRCPNCRRKCITHRQKENFMVLDKDVWPIFKGGDCYEQ